MTVLPGGDQVTAAAQTEIAVVVMQFDIPADFLQTAEDLTAWRKEEIIGDHGESEREAYATNSLVVLQEQILRHMGIIVDPAIYGWLIAPAILNM